MTEGHPHDLQYPTPQSHSATTPSSDNGRRAHSMIEFPSADLNSAIAIAHIVAKHPGASCSATELAEALNIKFDSSAFRQRAAAAARFALLQNSTARNVSPNLAAKL